MSRIYTHATPDGRPSDRHERRLVAICFVMFAAFFAWAFLFPLVEVSSGQGTVITGSREQVIESYDGGILVELLVREGEMVEEGQELARLDPTRSASSVEEAAARYHAAIAAAARLRAELDGADDVTFPEALAGAAYDDLRASELALFRARRTSLAEALSGLEEGLALIQQEIDIVAPLQSAGAASMVELIRLRREAAQTALKIARLRADSRVQIGEELQRMTAEAEVQGSVMRGRTDQLDRLVLRAPMRGRVKDIAVTTMGGMIPPNGEVMTLVPSDDLLLVEARISPRDIAYIYPGQEAQVKLTAYDYAIYGGLAGEVETISPDTIRDEVNPEQVFYRAYIRLAEDHLVNANGTIFPVVPGMIATVDIRTGEKTVWQYLVKPFNRAQEALRER